MISQHCWRTMITKESEGVCQPIQRWSNISLMFLRDTSDTTRYIDQSTEIQRFSMAPTAVDSGSEGELTHRTNVRLQALSNNLRISGIFVSEHRKSLDVWAGVLLKYTESGREVSAKSDGISVIMSLRGRRRLRLMMVVLSLVVVVAVGVLRVMRTAKARGRWSVITMMRQRHWSSHQEKENTL